ncbi:unnamed protein product (mitochondrion) [Plasmodiophora brassicae]|uniref:PAP-associated domain-containing protein n=1 Tax=Plasmodiophora brassicae TaxID=37360 RepID=A0A3P3XYU4_PLABS|nr:unnamed protein product [Plasmodiophora brassicae]
MRIRSSIVVAVGLLIVLCDAGKRRTGVRRRAAGPVDHREHIAEAVLRLEEARSSLCEAERIVLNAAQSFGYLLGDPPTSDSTRVTTRHTGYAVPSDEILPDFEVIFKGFEDTFVSIVMTHIRLALEGNFCAKRDCRDIALAIASLVRFDGAHRFQAMHQISRPPNIYAMRNASYISLPVQRFWNVTNVPINDLTHAIAITSNQVTASRSMVRDICIDSLLLQVLCLRVIDISTPGLQLGDALLTSRLCRTSPMETTRVEKFEAFRASLDRVRSLFAKISHALDLFQAATRQLVSAYEHVERSHYVVSLEPLLSGESTDTKPRRPKRKHTKKRRSIDRFPISKATSANTTVSSAPDVETDAVPVDPERNVVPKSAVSELLMTVEFNKTVKALNTSTIEPVPLGGHGAPGIGATLRGDDVVRQQCNCSVDVDGDACEVLHQEDYCLGMGNNDDDVGDHYDGNEGQSTPKALRVAGTLTESDSGCKRDNGDACSASSFDTFDDELWEPEQLDIRTGEPTRGNEMDYSSAAGSEDIPPGIEQFLNPPPIGGTYLETDLCRFVDWVNDTHNAYALIRDELQEQVERMVHVVFPGSKLSPMLSPVDDLYKQAPFTGLDLTISHPSLNGADRDLRYLEVLHEAVKGVPVVSSSATLVVHSIPKLVFRIQGSPWIATISWNTSLSNGFALEASAKYPLMKPIMFYAWYYLVRHGLHDVSQGGIDWQLLQVMVVSHMQVNADDCRTPFQGRCLRSFFTYYGTRFDYRRDCISVIGNGRVFPKAGRDAMVSPEFRLCAESPNDRTVDLGIYASRIGAVVEKFKKASEYLFPDYFPGQLTSGDMFGR